MQVDFQENSYTLDAQSLAYFDASLTSISNAHFFLSVGKFQGVGSFYIHPAWLKNVDFARLITKELSIFKEKIIWVEKFSFTDPFRFWHYLHHLFPENRLLVAALDMAGWVLFSEMEKKNLPILWKNYATQAPKISIQIFDQNKWAFIPKKTDHLTGVFIDKTTVPQKLAEDNNLENIDFFVLSKDLDIGIIQLFKQQYPKPFFVEIDGDTTAETIENIDAIKGVYITPYELGGVSPCLLAIEKWKKNCPSKKILLGTGVSDDFGKTILCNFKSLAPCFVGM